MDADSAEGQTRIQLEERARNLVHNLDDYGSYADSEELFDRLHDLPAYKRSTKVFVDFYSVMNKIRLDIVKDGKIVVCPRFKFRGNNLLCELIHRGDPQTKQLEKNVKAWLDVSNEVELDNQEEIDICVVASAAVSSKGERIPLDDTAISRSHEFMSSLGLVNPRTPVVTVVEDHQVLELPVHMFDDEVSVDAIITPSETIISTEPPPRPDCVNWGRFKKNIFSKFPVIQRIRYRDWVQGRNVMLQNEDNNPEFLEDSMFDVEEFCEKMLSKVL